MKTQLKKLKNYKVKTYIEAMEEILERWNLKEKLYENFIFSSHLMSVIYGLRDKKYCVMYLNDKVLVLFQLSVENKENYDKLNSLVNNEFHWEHYSTIVNE